MRDAIAASRQRLWYSDPETGEDLNWGVVDDVYANLGLTRRLNCPTRDHLVVALAKWPGGKRMLFIKKWISGTENVLI